MSGAGRLSKFDSGVRYRTKNKDRLKIYRKMRYHLQKARETKQKLEEFDKETEKK